MTQTRTEAPKQLPQDGAQKEQALAPVTKADISAVDGRLQLGTLTEIFRFGQYVIQSGMFPQFNHPSQIVLVSQIASDTNIPLSQALQNIAFINGRACMWGDALISAAFGSGQMEDFCEHFEGEGDSLTAVCRVVRKGIASAFVRTFSVADATKAKLWNNPKRDPWIKYPQRMLQMRARSWCLRDAGLTQGIIAREEASDIAYHENNRALPPGDGKKQTFGFTEQGPEELPVLGDAPDAATKQAATEQVDALKATQAGEGSAQQPAEAEAAPQTPEPAEVAQASAQPAQQPAPRAPAADPESRAAAGGGGPLLDPPAEAPDDTF